MIFHLKILIRMVGVLGQEDGKIMSEEEWGEWWKLAKKDIWRVE